ncbi:uncharacterized protein EV420DRAFT_630545 [Desarmillaria tabescens]|uniref:DUF6534 domain-containing protein n=1 Tax=Armillaria tabescens TaxID=1929756 RepID=A0AA39MZQ9_ARMTA|nr:uncharacterized protein EV420DRAFT_630545 [Desarmillaria tabescens]KAK0452911.1 hypothetical protein EV420DRAFT_630545 [Desarmillaria tabescens]
MSTATAIPPLDNTMGALLVGVLFSTALWGTTCVQTFSYLNRYWRLDTLGFRILVLATFAMDTLHEILICHTIYTYLVSNFANPAQLEIVEWSILVEVVASACVALMVQSFFTYRVWILSHKNLYLILFLGSLVGAEFFVCIAYFAKSWSVEVYSDSYKVRSLSQSMNALAAAGDLAICGSLIVLLHRSKSGMKRSDAMMNKMILFTMNTGLLTSICAIMSLIMILVYPNTFLYITFFFNLSRLYSNSLLATLNARRGMKTTVDGSALGASFTLDSDGRRVPISAESASKPRHIVINRNVDVEVLGDYEMDSVTSI